MLFMFPGSTAAGDLETELAPFFELVKAELQRVSDVQISLIGWSEASRCQIRASDGRISQIVFDAVSVSGEAPRRIRRPGATICERPAGKPVRGLGFLLGDDD